MQGHGYVEARESDDTRTGAFRKGTLEWLVATDPEQYGRLKTTPDYSDWKNRSDVWVAYNRQRVGNVRPEINQYHSYLRPGIYGGDPGQTDQMGPELGFGWTVGDALNNPTNSTGSSSNNGATSPSATRLHVLPQQQKILLLKIAWGGRSLAVDFRPPSSSSRDGVTTTGLYYESLLANTFRTLSRLGELFPDYEQLCGGNYELAGLVWHQGWNDGCDVNMTAEYESNLANLIRDLRIDLGTPQLPVAIGVSGMGGYSNSTRRNTIIAAQFAVANATKYPEFHGTVATVETRSFFRRPYPESPGTQVYHWNNNCESYWLIGRAMGKAMLRLLDNNIRRRGGTNAILDSM